MGDESEERVERILTAMRNEIWRTNEKSWLDPRLRPFAERLARAEAAVQEWFCDRCRMVVPSSGIHSKCGLLVRPSSFDQRQAEARADCAEAECQHLGRRYASITDAARRAGLERLEEEAEGGLTDGERVDRIERAFRLAAFYSKNGCIVCTRWPHQEHCPVLQMGEKVTGWSFAPGAEFNPSRSKR